MDNQCKRIFGHDLKLQTGFTDTSEPVLIIFPILLGFDALSLRISSQGISCTNIQLLEMLNEIFTFETFGIFHRWSIGGPPVATGGKASTLANFPPPMAIFGPPMATDGFPWVVSTGCFLFPVPYRIPATFSYGNLIER